MKLIIFHHNVLRQTGSNIISMFVKKNKISKQTNKQTNKNYANKQNNEYKYKNYANKTNNEYKYKKIISYIFYFFILHPAMYWKYSIYSIFRNVMKGNSLLAISTNFHLQILLTFIADQVTAMILSMRAPSSVFKILICTGLMLKQLLLKQFSLA